MFPNVTDGFAGRSTSVFERSASKQRSAKWTDEVAKEDAITRAVTFLEDALGYRWAAGSKSNSCQYEVILRVCLVGCILSVYPGIYPGMIWMPWVTGERVARVNSYRYLPIYTRYKLERQLIFASCV